MMFVRVLFAASFLGLSGCGALSFAQETSNGSTTSTITGSSSGSTSFSTATDSTGTMDLNALDDELTSLLAQFRAEQGKASQSRNVLLDRAAQNLADVMASKNTLSHTADGQRASERIKAAGYVTCTNGSPWSENIARSSLFGDTNTLADLIMTGWVNSPGHRQNMLGAFAEVGIAVAQTKDGKRVYAAQVFGTPGPGACL